VTEANASRERAGAAVAGAGAGAGPGHGPGAHHPHVAEASAATLQLRSTAGALKVLAERLQVLQAFVSACASGAVPLEGAARPLLREVSGLVARLPVGGAPGEDPAFERQLAHDTEDALMLAYAATLARGAQALAGVVEKLGVIGASAKDLAGGGSAAGGLLGLGRSAAGMGLPGLLDAAGAHGDRRPGGGRRR
jgi:hypothetical protein